MLESRFLHYSDKHTKKKLFSVYFNIEIFSSRVPGRKFHEDSVAYDTATTTAHTIFFRM